MKSILNEYVHPNINPFSASELDRLDSALKERIVATVQAAHNHAAQPLENDIEELANTNERLNEMIDFLMGVAGRSMTNTEQKEFDVIKFERAANANKS